MKVPSFIRRVFFQFTLDDPKANELWVLADDTSNPFNRGDAKVVVLDVKEGWVKYEHTASWAILEYTMEISRFKAIYVKLQE